MSAAAEAILVRAATPADHDALREHCEHLNHYEEALSHDRRLGPVAAAETLAAALARVDSTGGAALVAEVDGAVAGHLFLTLEEAGVFVREELRRYAYVADLFVREPLRRRGIATALLAEAERIAARHGLRRMLIGVLDGNVPAERAYARFGFRAYALEMQKLLGGSAGSGS